MLGWVLRGASSFISARGRHERLPLPTAKREVSALDQQYQHATSGFEHRDVVLRPTNIGRGWVIEEGMSRSKVHLRIELGGLVGIGAVKHDPRTKPWTNDDPGRSRLWQASGSAPLDRGSIICSNSVPQRPRDDSSTTKRITTSYEPLAQEVPRLSRSHKRHPPPETLRDRYTHVLGARHDTTSFGSFMNRIYANNAGGPVSMLE